MLSIRALRKKRNGISPITAGFGLIIIIIIIAVGLLLLLSAGGLANIGIGGNGSNATSNVPAQIIITTTNPTLEQSIAPAGSDLLYYKPLVLQPNTNYMFPITITVENSAGNILNTSVVIAPVNRSFNSEDNILCYVLPSSGASPLNGTLVIKTGSTINFGRSIDIAVNLNFESPQIYANISVPSILFTNSSYNPNLNN